MTTVSLYRLHTDALDERTLQAIADRIHQTNPNQKVYIYDIERDMESSEVEEIYEKPHDADCGCGQCSGEDRALEQMEKGIVDAETNYRE